MFSSNPPFVYAANEHGGSAQGENIKDKK